MIHKRSAVRFEVRGVVPRPRRWYGGLAALLAMLVAVPPALADGNTPGQQIVRGGEQASIAGSAQVFTGNARIDPLSPVNADINVSTAYVTFEPGARSAWHTHPKGQYLIVTAGFGLTQEWGKPIQQIRPGDVVWCPPGVKHWHGASPTTAMTHIAVTGSADGKNVGWLEKVSDEQYMGL